MRSRLGRESNIERTAKAPRGHRRRRRGARSRCATASWCPACTEQRSGLIWTSTGRRSPVQRDLTRARGTRPRVAGVSSFGAGSQRTPGPGRVSPSPRPPSARRSRVPCRPRPRPTGRDSAGGARGTRADELTEGDLRACFRLDAADGPASHSRNTSRSRGLPGVPPAYPGRVPGRPAAPGGWVRGGVRLDELPATTADAAMSPPGVCGGVGPWRNRRLGPAVRGGRAGAARAALNLPGYPPAREHHWLDVNADGAAGRGTATTPNQRDPDAPRVETEEGDGTRPSPWPSSTSSSSASSRRARSPR
ncbi:hypothetical protein LV779_34475 [Streptomyces thinghirensis]|nr:hypothetical protein [Streptomyces thinghirensis]